MLSKEDCFILGVVTGPYRDEGLVSVLIDADDPSHYNSIDFLLIEVNNALVPFEVLSSSLKGKSVHLELSGIDDVDQALVLKNANVYLPLEALPKLSGKDFYLHEITGFQLIDSSKGAIGIIEEVYDLPQQTVASVIIEEKEVLIPLRKELIKEIDREAKTITIDIPDGLLDVYLDS